MNDFTLAETEIYRVINLTPKETRRISISLYIPVCWPSYERITKDNHILRHASISNTIKSVYKLYTVLLNVRSALHFE